MLRVYEIISHIVTRKFAFLNATCTFLQININFVLASIDHYIKLIHLFKNMRYKIHFSAFTLLCPWTASSSVSDVHIIQVLRVQSNCQHLPFPVPPTSPVQATHWRLPNLLRSVNSASFIQATCQPSPSMKGTHIVSLTSLHPMDGSEKEVPRTDDDWKTTWAIFIFSSLPSALITIFLHTEWT